MFGEEPRRASDGHTAVTGDRKYQTWVEKRHIQPVAPAEHHRHGRWLLSLTLESILLCFLLSASVHQDIQAQVRPQKPDQRRHGDQTEETTGGGAERPGRGGRGELGTHEKI